MSLERFCLKFFARPDHQIDEAIFIDIFHEWIRYQKLPGILLDVADYRHVPEGPGIMLITHQINFAMDHAEGRFGLYAQRKSGQADTPEGRLLELAQATVTFGALLEADARVAGRLSLEGGQFHYISNDRLLLPNTAQGVARIKPVLTAAAETIYPGQAVSLSRVENDPRDRLTILVDSGQPASMEELAARIAQPA